MIYIMGIICLGTWKMSRENDRLRKVHDEVEILQKQKNKVEEDLYKSQDARERLESILRKEDMKIV